jgi:hypothetical protein
VGGNDATLQAAHVAEGGSQSKRGIFADKGGSEKGGEESGQRRRTKSAIPVSDKASAGKRLEREKRAEGDERGGERMGTSKCQRLETADLVPVRKETWDEGVPVPVKWACW